MDRHKKVRYSPSTHPSPPDEKIKVIEEMERAFAAFGGGNLSAALKIIDDSLSRYPDYPALHSARGGIHLQASSQTRHDSAAHVEHLKSALDSERRALQLAPNCISYAHFHARALFQLAQNDAALDYDYNAVIEACERALLLPNPAEPMEDLLDVEEMAYVDPCPVNRIEEVRKKLVNLMEKSKKMEEIEYKTLKNFQEIEQPTEAGLSRPIYVGESSASRAISDKNPIPQVFDRCSVYNSCFPPIKILDWFTHQSNEPQLTVKLPPSCFHNDSGWIGFALCASFSVNEYSTPILENLERETSHYLSCCLEAEIGSIGPPHSYCPARGYFKLLNLGGFMWLSYIPRSSLPDSLNKCRGIEASIFSDSPSLTVQNCGFRLVFWHDEEEFKEAIRHCVDALSDSWVLIRQMTVDHKQRNSKQILDDETIPSRTGSSSEDADPKRLGGSVDHRLKDKGKRVVE